MDPSLRKVVFDSLFAFLSKSDYFALEMRKLRRIRISSHYVYVEKKSFLNIKDVLVTAEECRFSLENFILSKNSLLKQECKKSVAMQNFLFNLGKSINKLLIMNLKHFIDYNNQNIKFSITFLLTLIFLALGSDYAEIKKEYSKIKSGFSKDQFGLSKEQESEISALIKQGNHFINKKLEKNVCDSIR